MSGQYKDGKKIVPKPKAPKRKSAEELYVEHNTALLLKKLNLLQKNIADDFLDDKVRSQKIYERAIDLVTLHPFEMLIRLASTELHLETTMFLYHETYKQKQFLEAAYVESGTKGLVKATNISKGKLSPAYLAAKELLDDMKEKNFKIFCKKMRARLSDMDLPASSLRNYYLKITGKKSTK
jgi:diacylglycerol kinase family enzyme